MSEDEAKTVKKPSLNRSAKDRRNTLFRVLDGVLSLSHKKIHSDGNSDKAKQGWARVLVSAVSAYTGLLKDEELELRVMVMFAIQPIILGVLNIIVLHRLYNCKGWQIGFWLNGFFLLMLFSTINLIIQTTLGLNFSVWVGIIEVFLLSYPFGYLGKFRNRGCNNTNPQ